MTQKMKRDEFLSLLGETDERHLTLAVDDDACKRAAYRSFSRKVRGLCVAACAAVILCMTVFALPYIPTEYDLDYVEADSEYRSVWIYYPKDGSIERKRVRLPYNNENIFLCFLHLSGIDNEYDGIDEFLSQHEGDEFYSALSKTLPDYKTSAPDTTDSDSGQTKPNEESTVTYDQSEKYYSAYFSVPTKLFAVIERYKGKEYVDRFIEMNAYTEQYSIGAFCEYFNVDFYTYILMFEGERREKSIEYSSTAELLGYREDEEESDYISKISASPEYFYREFFGEWYNSKVFIKENYAPEYHSVCIMPDSDGCTHTSYYHMIDSRLIKAVGADAFESFKEKYAGSENFNIIKFTEEFRIDKNTYENIYESVLPPYNAAYLYGHENMRKEYFESVEANIAFGMEGAVSYKYNESYGHIPIDIIKELGIESSFEIPAQIYDGCSLPIGLICEYFGISEDEYKTACISTEVYQNNLDDITKLRAQISTGTDIDRELLWVYSPYVWELHFGEYNENELFFNQYYTPGETPDLCITPEVCRHVRLYHTIDSRLLSYVGKDKAAEFAEKYKDTEDFNIIRFIEYFDISKEEYEDIILEFYFNSTQRYYERILPYPTDYLYGDDAARMLCFERQG